MPSPSRAASIDYSTTDWLERSNESSQRDARSRVRDQRQICASQRGHLPSLSPRLNVLWDSSPTRPDQAATVAKARVIRESNLRNRIFGRDRRLAGYEYNYSGGPQSPTDRQAGGATKRGDSPAHQSPPGNDLLQSIFGVAAKEKIKVVRRRSASVSEGPDRGRSDRWRNKFETRSRINLRRQRV